MTLKKLILLIGSTLMGMSSVLGCSAGNDGTAKGGGPEPLKFIREAEHMKAEDEYRKTWLNKTGKNEEAAEIYLAGGCFWGTEAYFAQLPGVLATDVGYANGRTEETSYHELKNTGHAETVHVVYNPDVISLAELLDRYYMVIDPLSLNKQGNDRGTQYRTGIYYKDAFSEKVAGLSLDLLNERLGQKSYVELEPLKNYILAEDYHQDYLEKNPGGYCHVDLGLARRPLFPVPEVPAEQALRDSLSPEAYRVTQEQGTELAFTNPLNKEFGEGVYLDAVTGQVLFSSRDKYDAGNGWPAFRRPIVTDALTYHEESPGTAEVRNSSKSAHLGHVFDEQGMGECVHYCINGASLRFVPKDKMREEGLERFLPYLLKP